MVVEGKFVCGSLGGKFAGSPCVLGALRGLGVTGSRARLVVVVPSVYSYVFVSRLNVITSSSSLLLQFHVSCMFFFHVDPRFW